MKRDGSFGVAEREEFEVALKPGDVQQKDGQEARELRM